VVLTKLDGDTRGGAALSIGSIVNKAIKFVGTGEKMEALDVFHPTRTETGPSVTPDTQDTPDAPFMGLTASVNYDAVEKERESIDKQTMVLINEIVNICKEFTGDSEDESKFYAWINKEANRAVKITRKDSLTPVNVLHDRLKWLVHFHYKIKKTPTELNQFYIIFNNKNNKNKTKSKFTHGMI